MSNDTFEFFSQPKIRKTPPPINKPKKTIEETKPIEKTEVRVRESSKEVQPSSETLKTYPERKFDRYQHKNARLNTDDLELLSILCKEIALAKSRMGAERKTNTRITENTILREVLSLFCRKIEHRVDTLNFEELQTEKEIVNFIETVMVDQ
jgi:hypothetical protein